jgi:membrane-bound lytic murein transglycosylase D
MISKLFFTAIFLTIFTALSGHTSSSGDTIILRSDIETEKITRDLDSLVSSWYVRMALRDFPFDFEHDSAGVVLPDSIYERRLSQIHSVINLPFNSIVRNHIHVYTIRQREKFAAVLGLMNYYFPMIEDIFDSYGLPTELKYMAVIESALNVNAVSRVGATGMWQFMHSTGKAYGLTINSVIDERRDPVKSTHAAARFIKDLYNIYNDWILVIAAYNCGPGNVNKAIRRSDNRKDYWEIYYRLPRETRGYIPQYVAAAYAINYFGEHRIMPLPLNIPVSTDTIMFSKDIHLSQISEVMGIPAGELRALNPQYRTGLVPGSSKPMALTLPLAHLGDFIDLNDTIRNYKSDVYLSKTTRIDDPSRTTFTPVNITGKTRLTYTVKEGDNLGFIAEWYRVGLSDLRNWNNVYSNRILVGQKLAVYVDPARSEYFEKINTMSFAEKQKMIGKSIPSNTSAPATQALATTGDGEYITYTVRNGDTVWEIARMFGDVTASDVLKLNNISDPAKIRVGQILRIRKKS